MKPLWFEECMYTFKGFTKGKRYPIYKEGQHCRRSLYIDYLTESDDGNLCLIKSNAFTGINYDTREYTPKPRQTTEFTIDDVLWIVGTLGTDYFKNKLDCSNFVITNKGDAEYNRVIREARKFIDDKIYARTKPADRDQFYANMKEVEYLSGDKTVLDFNPVKRPTQVDLLSEILAELKNISEKLPE